MILQSLVITAWKMPFMLIPTETRAHISHRLIRNSYGRKLVYKGITNFWKKKYACSWYFRSPYWYISNCQNILQINYLILISWKLSWIFSFCCLSIYFFKLSWIYILQFSSSFLRKLLFLFILMFHMICLLNK